MTHIPVMTAEVLQHLRPDQGGLFVDCTVGLGGHSRALLEAGASRVIGLDRDLDALARARDTLAPWGDRVELVHADYRAIDEVLDSRQIAHVDGALADLGVSSMQFDAPGRGFSFQRDEPLDMRMDRIGRRDRRRSGRASRANAISRTRFFSTAKSASRGASRARWSRRAARRRSRRPGGSPTIVRRAIPHRGGHVRIDPATKTFQALRIWVNRELDGLDRFVDDRRPAAARRRAPGGDHVSLARRPHREAHAARAAAARRAGAGADEEAAGPDRRRSGPQSAGAQRQAPRRGKDGLMEAFEYAIKKDVRNNPIVREVDEARQRELWTLDRRRRLPRARPARLGVAALRAAPPRLPGRGAAAAAHRRGGHRAAGCASRSTR